jgi:hypothetical protein
MGLTPRRTDWLTVGRKVTLTLTLTLGRTHYLAVFSAVLHCRDSVSKRALQHWKLVWIYSYDIYNVLNCHNVAKHTEFYLWELQFNVTSNGNAGYYKKSFTFQMLLSGVERWIVCTPLIANVVVTLATQQHLEHTIVNLFLKRLV